MFATAANHTRTIVRTMRIPFLILTPVSVFLGVCSSWVAQGQIDYRDMILVLAGALSAHISANMFNEFFDIRSGLDAKTTRTAFSGGSGGLINDPTAVNAVLYIAIATLGITVLVGGYFALQHGIVILLIGIIGMLIILTYTQWLNRHPLLCLIAPGLSFGPLMVVGTHFVLTDRFSAFAVFVSLIPFFLVNNLLLLNQFPDVSADMSVGRRHFPIVYGTKSSVNLYGAFAVATAAMVVTGLLLGYLPKMAAISLLPLSATLNVYLGAMKYAASTDKLLPYLRTNVLITILTPVFLGIGVLSAG
jgi:1,4-dihydroxy-2-naphthoate octaprenyltransferase